MRYEQSWREFGDYGRLGRPAGAADIYGRLSGTHKKEQANDRCGKTTIKLQHVRSIDRRSQPVGCRIPGGTRGHARPNPGFHARCSVVSGAAAMRQPLALGHWRRCGTTFGRSGELRPGMLLHPKRGQSWPAPLTGLDGSIIRHTHTQECRAECLLMAPPTLVRVPRRLCPIDKSSLRRCGIIRPSGTTYHCAAPD